VFLVGDRRTKCLRGDRQRTVWCLQQHQLCYLRNRRTKCALTVSWRRPGKLGCRSNSPSFCAAQATSHVSSELCTFRCLVGHVWQRCGPVSRNTVGTMVDVCQVMVAHTIICKIQASRLSTLVRNESRCSCSCTEILAFLTTKLELPSPLLSDSPFSPPNSFFVFLYFQIVRNAKSRPTFWRTFHRPCDHKFSITANCRYWKFHCQNPAKTKIETPLGMGPS
jgi:hypothetical protein